MNDSKTPSFKEFLKEHLTNIPPDFIDDFFTIFPGENDYRNELFSKEFQ